MTLIEILILALVQGAAELLPVSSSAHVIVAEKLMGLDPTAPEMTLLLVMLHTGTMFAVIVYFWSAGRTRYLASLAAFGRESLRLVVATALTGLVGGGLVLGIHRVLAHGHPGFEIEHLFGNARLMAAALAAAGLLIIAAARLADRGRELTLRHAAWIGAVQGLCLPVRGFSRSGATISTGLLLGVGRRQAEEFSFALAVVLTPAAIAREGWRLVKAHALAGDAVAAHLFVPGLIGMALAFLAGLGALRWLSRWLEQGRWHFFGAYCLGAALVVLWVG